MNAPQELIEFNKDRAGQTQKLLRALLTDKSMDKPWGILGRRVSGSNQWIMLWQRISYAVFESRKVNKRLRPGDISSDLLLVRDAAIALEKRVEKIQNKTKVLLNVSVFDLFPEDAKALVPEDHALACGPYINEILSELAAMAERSAERKPDQVIEKVKERSAETVFCRIVYQGLEEHGWEPKDQIFSVVAAIGNVAIGTGFLKTSKGEMLDGRFVRKAVLPGKGG